MDECLSFINHVWSGWINADMTVSNLLASTLLIIFRSQLIRLIVLYLEVKVGSLSGLSKTEIRAVLM